MQTTTPQSTLPAWRNYLQSPAFLVVIVLASILAAWSNSYRSPLAFDDLGSIRDNATIRPPYQLDALLNPPSEGGQTVAGRPLLNLSFALDQWLYGENYTGYRVTNVLIHCANALLIFALVRLSLQNASTSNESRKDSILPFAITLLWSLHPLTTSAVSYLAQRAESLTAFWLLLTLYAFARAQRATSPIPWLTLSLLACYLGIATKETMAAAPFIVALYAWTFRATSTPAIPIKTRTTFFALLFAALIPLLLLTISTGDRAGTASATVSLDSLPYLKSQTWALLRYLQLSFWPSQLVFDYGRDRPIPDLIVWLSCGTLILFLLALSVYHATKKSSLGFLGLSAFLLLAPSSSIFPLTDPVFEHRFYLPLVCVIALSLILLNRISKRLLLPATLILAVTLGLATHHRNEDYRDELALWQDSLAFSDLNARAHTNLGTLYLAKSENDQAIDHLRRAVEIAPTPLRLHNLANALSLNHKPSEAIPLFKQVLVAEPNFQAAILGLAQALQSNGDFPQAIEQYQTALQSQPDNILALRSLATSQLAQQDVANALETYQRITELTPDRATAYFDLGDAFARAGRFPDAKSAFVKTTELDPRNAQAFANLGNLYLMEKDYPQAIQAYEKSIAVEPTAIAHTNLAISLIYSKRISEAKTQLQNALKLDHNYAPAQNIIQKLR